jgi:hypothetical protein
MYKVERHDNQPEHTKAKTKERTTTGFAGVSWQKRTGKFEAYVNMKGKKYHVGVYDNPYAADRARIAWMKEHGIDNTPNNQKTHEENHTQQPNTVIQLPLQGERKENTMIEQKSIEQKLAELQSSTSEWLPVDLLNIDRNYQRDPGSSKIKAISDNFNLAAAGILIVSQRSNGLYFVVDGQHRLEAMKKLNIQQVECKVSRGLSVTEEAEIFIHCNTVRKNPTAIDVFKARLFKKDPIAMEINQIVEKYGLFIQLNGSSTNQRDGRAICAVFALIQIYERGQAPLLEEILTLITRTWPGDSNVLEGKMLQGITDFHLKYQGRYTREEFVRKLSIADPLTIRRRAIYLAENNRESIMKGISRAIQEAYDKGRRIRLPDRLQQTEDK